MIYNAPKPSSMAVIEDMHGPKAVAVVSLDMASDSKLRLHNTNQPRRRAVC